MFILIFSFHIRCGGVEQQTNIDKLINLIPKRPIEAPEDGPFMPLLCLSILCILCNAGPNSSISQHQK